ncbi:MAG: glycerol kinase [Alicyclobacillus sp.]|nr:glycerol kinase [Alicyclobacillus sp.]
MKYILSLDQGTTGTKALLFDTSGAVCARAYRAHEQHHPAPGWVEHDADEIWQCVLAATQEALRSGGVRPHEIAGIALANQGETVLAFSRSTAQPLHRAIVWSDRRTTERFRELEQDDDFCKRVHERTGLRVDPYFSAPKMNWLLEHCGAVQEATAAGDLCLSTLDAWLIRRMTGGASYVTDTSTASRTLLLNIHKRSYEPEHLARFGVPREALPAVVDTCADFGVTDPAAFLGICAPIVVSIVDQPAALFGHLCLDPGEAKCTYGTGCFLYMNIGEEPVRSDHGMLTTLVWSDEGRATFALEGGVYSAGSALDWLCSVGVLGRKEDLDAVLAAAPSSEGVWFVPALTGMAAPYWDSEVRASFSGLSSATTAAHLAHAVVEGIAHRVADVVEVMSAESGRGLRALRADGGLTHIPRLMQHQADLLGIPVEVLADHDATAAGAAYMAGLRLGMMDLGSIRSRRRVAAVYQPAQDAAWRAAQRRRWKRVVEHVRSLSAGLRELS